MATIHSTYIYTYTYGRYTLDAHQSYFLSEKGKRSCGLFYSLPRHSHTTTATTKITITPSPMILTIARVSEYAIPCFGASIAGTHRLFRVSFKNQEVHTYTYTYTHLTDTDSSTTVVYDKKSRQKKKKRRWSSSSWPSQRHTVTRSSCIYIHAHDYVYYYTHISNRFPQSS